MYRIYISATAKVKSKNAQKTKYVLFNRPTKEPCAKLNGKKQLTITISAGGRDRRGEKGEGRRDRGFLRAERLKPHPASPRGEGTGDVS